MKGFSPHVAQGRFIRWSNPIVRGPAETPGEVGQEPGASASWCRRARKVARPRGRHQKCRSSYQVHIVGLVVMKQVYHRSFLTISQDWGISHKGPVTNVTVGNPEGFVNLILRFSLCLLRWMQFSQENGVLFTPLSKNKSAA